MNNRMMMNIIYNQQYEAEAEYIKEFFNLIGIIITDICLPNNEYLSAKHIYGKKISKQLEKDNYINVFLNYYGNPLKHINGEGRINIFMYFDIEKGFVDIDDKPRESNPITVLKRSNQLVVIRGDCKPQIVELACYKKSIRSQALDMLISKIWKYEPKTLFSIRNIRNNYVPENSNNDFFYTLQTTNCINTILGQNYLKNSLTNPDAYDFTLSLNDDYLVYTFNELARMYRTLTSDCLYSLYTKTKVAISILDVYKLLNYNDKILFRSKVPYININDLSSFITYALSHLKGNNFINAYLLSTKDAVSFLNSRKMIDYPTPFYQAKLNDILPKGFSYEARITEHLQDNKYCGELDKMLSLIKLFPSSNASIFSSYNYAFYIMSAYGTFKERDFILIEAIKEFKNNRKLLDIFGTFLSQYFIAKIMINSNREQSAKSFIIDTYSSLINFENAYVVKKLADKGETAFNDFIKFHYNSKYLYLLYKVMEPWVNGIILSFEHKELVNERLSMFRFGDKYVPQKSGFQILLRKYGGNK